MLLPDVNVLVYAHRVESPEHARFADWLTRVATGAEPFALATLALSGFLRIVTHPAIFKAPTPLKVALEFIDQLRRSGNAVEILPGQAHWEIFTRLCRESDARGKLVADAFLAALAIENGCELATTDGDFARFGGLRWRHPLLPENKK